jgi:hypothetical protein
VKQVKDGTSTVGLLHAADISEILSTEELKSALAAWLKQARASSVP